MSEMSPGRLARIAGALYLVNILLGAFAIGYVTAAVGSDVHAHELLFRSGVAAHVVVTVTNIGLALIFYELFKVVGRRVAMLVVFFTLVATAIEAAGIVSQLSALTFAPATAAYDVSTVFFAGYALAIGYLIYHSTFMPRVIGVLMAIDGVAYLVNSFATILAPDFAAHLVPYIQLPVLLGEGSLTLWLLIAGINTARWARMNVEKRA
jgi:hypothetical protein